MTQALDNACTQIATTLAAVPNIQSVPINPPETVNVNTVCLVFPEAGDFGAAPIGTRRGLHQIAIYLMQRRIDLSNDIATIKPFIDTISAQLLNEVSPAGTTLNGIASGGLFGGSITTFETVSYKFEFLEYAGVDFVVYHFIMQNVKILI